MKNLAALVTVMQAATALSSSAGGLDDDDEAGDSHLVGILSVAAGCVLAIIVFVAGWYFVQERCRASRASRASRVRRVEPGQEGAPESGRACVLGPPFGCVSDELGATLLDGEADSASPLHGHRSVAPRGPCAEAAEGELSDERHAIQPLESPELDNSIHRAGQPGRMRQG